jgi:hypothetical protein
MNPLSGTTLDPASCCPRSAYIVTQEALGKHDSINRADLRSRLFGDGDGAING